MEIKKSMVDVLAFVTENGNMSKANLELFTKQFCVAKSGSTGSTSPKEFVKLFDSNGNLLGRKCTVSGKWLTAENFSKDASMSKQADKVKAKLYTESKAMEKDAQSLVANARTITDVNEKLAAYEAFDSAMEAARQHRLQDVVVDFGDTATYDSIDELASALGVEVITTIPTAE